MKLMSCESSLSNIGTLTRRESCRLCGSDKLELVMRLTATPPANAFVSTDHLGEKDAVYPLDLHLCLDCGHLQLLDIVSADVLFRNYVYVSGTSPVFVEHFRQYAEDLMKLAVWKLRGHPLPRATCREQDLAAPAGNKLVLDIGSNDGTMLKFFKAKGLRVLGVDPALDIAKGASDAGIPTLPAFFTEALAEEIKAKHGAASIVVANNVFAHADDLLGIARGVRGLLAPEGIFVFEVSYLVDVVEKTLFDTIYHEHLSYHALKPLKSFFERLGMEIFDAERVLTHGGSLRCFVQRRGAGRPLSSCVDNLINLEAKLGLHAPEAFRAFAGKIERLGNELGTLLRDLKAKGKKVAGYGAPAKATTLLYQFNLANVLDFIVDDSPLKQNLYTPGYHIPVLSSRAIVERKPDYLLLLAWNFAESIIKNNKTFLDQGGHIIVPLPELRVV